MKIHWKREGYYITFKHLSSSFIITPSVSITHGPKNCLSIMAWHYFRHCLPYRITKQFVHTRNIRVYTVWHNWKVKKTRKYVNHSRFAILVKSTTKSERISTMLGPWRFLIIFWLLNENKSKMRAKNSVMSVNCVVLHTNVPIWKEPIQAG